MNQALVESFIQKVVAVGGRVSRTGRDGLAQTIAGLAHTDRPVIVTPELHGLADELRERGVDAMVGTREGVGKVTDETFEDVLRRSVSAVSGSLLAIASSGSIAVGPGGGNGGLLIAYPPHSLIIVVADDIHPSLDVALEEVRRRFDEVGGEVVFVSGPSRTADIEMMSVVGVHGPTELDVVILEEERI